MPKNKPIAITISRSFAALARVASSDAKAEPWRRSVLIEALAKSRVRGTACNGFALMRMEGAAPAVNLELFGDSTESAPAGTKAAPPADDLATAVRAVKPVKDGGATAVDIVVGEDPSIRCGSEARRVQIAGDSALAGWPKGIADLIPTGEPVIDQCYSAELLRDLLSAIVAAGATRVTLELRANLTAMRLAAECDDGASVVGVLAQIDDRDDGDVVSADASIPGVDTVTISSGDKSVTMTGKEFARAGRRLGK